MKLKTIATLLTIGMGISQMAYAEQYAWALPQNAHGKVTENITITSLYRYKLVNDTSDYHHYNGYEEIEINGKTHKRDLSFSVPPRGGKVENQDTLKFNYKPNKVGTFKIRSHIKILGPRGVAHNASADLKVTE